MRGQELAGSVCWGDLADENFCRQAVAAAVARWGGVDYLVNNAFDFIAEGGDATRDDWNRMMQVGPIGYATIGQLAAEAMKELRGGGAIVISPASPPHRSAESLDIQCGKRGRESVDPLYGFGPRTPRHPRQHAESRLDLAAKWTKLAAVTAKWVRSGRIPHPAATGQRRGDRRARRFPV